MGLTMASMWKASRRPLSKRGASRHATATSRYQPGPIVGRNGPVSVTSIVPSIQAKLKVGEPNDRYEREADRVADEVMRMPANTLSSGGLPESRSDFELPRGGTSASIQRMCSACAEEEDELRRIPSKSPSSTPAHRDLNGSRNAVLPEAMHRSNATLTSPLEQSIRHARGYGAPLPTDALDFLEPRFGRDFTGVRIHADRASSVIAQRLQARAFTLGRDIFFAPGEFNPGTPTGLRVLSHELTHAVQQRAVPLAETGSASGQHITAGAAGTVQRAVECDAKSCSIERAENVLASIKTIGESYLTDTRSGDKLADLVAEKGSGIASKAVANNLARLVALSKRFNPGAPGQKGPTNAFVYTCNCGWIDMGHFFISAAGAFTAAYVQQLGLRIEGVPRTQGELLKMGLDEIAPWLELLLNTVSPGGRGKKILEEQRELLESGEPRDISLALGGYATEYYQQLFKLFADPLKEVPEWLKGEQRSAFTMEDLPSDCYGAELGQDLWYQVGHIQRGLDRSPVVDLMRTFFKECRAVFPEGETRCEMMAEIVPGSCRMEEGKPKWSEDGGTPRQHTSTAPYLLKSAKSLCPTASPRACKSGTATGQQLTAAELDASERGKSATLILPDDITLYEPKERAYFGGEFRVPGRPERFDPSTRLTLGGPTLLRINTKGDVFAYSTLQGLQGFGETRISAHFSLPSGRISARAEGSVVDVEGSAELHIDIDGLFKELVDLASPEAERFRKILQSKEFESLLKKLIFRQIGIAEFYGEAKAILQSGFPEGFEEVGLELLNRLRKQLLDELLPLYTGVKGRGTVSAFGLPISYLTVSKGTGRKSPLWGTEFGFLTSELLNKRVSAGAKVWLYGDKLLQAHATAGVDLFSQKGFADLQVKNKTWTGMDLSARLRYEIDPQGEQLFLLTVGGQHNIAGSKPKETR